ncbi:hypothetical protein U2G91_26685 (plasmid) [Rhodococcoides fascians]|uniref:hypothetical protein n=2 Tax=Nocardiaceae TaxID=85025 RepID=UPI002ACE4065|nr:hypothetical protein [Rhodococcus fascians]WQH31149.1 hypothetical protein U2G91_26685 [Rhodococcus fascians]
MQNEASDVASGCDGGGTSDALSWEGWLCLKDRTWQQVAGPADWPRILLWEVKDRMSDEVLSDAIRDVWTGLSGNHGLVDLPGVPLPQYEGRIPDRLTAAEWHVLFDRVGYLSYEDARGESTTCERPTTLYRYAEHGGEIGWAWTVSAEAAAVFEDEFDDAVRPGCIWMVTDVDPDRLLAHFHSTPRPGDDSENEYVFEPSASEINHVRSGRGCNFV